MKHFAVLSTNPSDEDAMRCKVVALIKADNIDDALSTIQSSQKFTCDFNYLKVFNVVMFSFCFLFMCHKRKLVSFEEVCLTSYLHKLLSCHDTTNYL